MSAAPQLTDPSLTLENRVLVEPTNDMSLIRTILTDPALYDKITDDSSPPREQYQPIGPPAIHLLCLDRSDLNVLGLFQGIPRTLLELQVHCALLPHARGPLARVCARKSFQWIWDHTSFSRITGYIPSFNRAVVRYCKDIGMVQFGTNEMSFMKNGQFHDLICTGITRPGLRRQ